MFDLARSPPGGSNKSMFRASYMSSSLNLDRYEACSMQVLPTRRMPGWKCLPILTFDRSSNTSGTLQVLLEGKWMGSLSLMLN